MELSGKARRAARAILMYLSKHPDAKDSLTGIKQWWTNDPVEYSDEDLRAAAAALLERGWLRTWAAGPGSVIFGPSQKLLQEPDAVLREFQRECPPSCDNGASDC